MGPIRSVDHLALQTMAMEDIRPIARCDFDDAFHQVRAVYRAGRALKPSCAHAILVPAAVLLRAPLTTYMLRPNRYGLLYLPRIWKN
jgi:hypothetical protein